MPQQQSHISVALVLACIASSHVAFSAAFSAQCHSIAPVVTDRWCNLNCNHNPSFCPPFLCVCIGAACYHSADLADHKCYEACSTGAKFHTKGINATGRCDRAVFNIEDTSTSVYQCPDVRFDCCHVIAVTWLLYLFFSSIIFFPLYSCTVASLVLTSFPPLLPFVVSPYFFFIQGVTNVRYCQSTALNITIATWGEK